MINICILIKNTFKSCLPQNCALLSNICVFTNNLACRSNVAPEAASFVTVCSPMPERFDSNRNCFCAYAVSCPDLTFQDVPNDD